MDFDPVKARVHGVFARRFEVRNDSLDFGNAQFFRGDGFGFSHGRMHVGIGIDGRRRNRQAVCVLLIT